MNEELKKKLSEKFKMLFFVGVSNKGLYIHEAQTKCEIAEVSLFVLKVEEELAKLKAHLLADYNKSK